MKIRSRYQKILAAGNKPRTIRSQRLEALSARLQAQQNTTRFRLLVLAIPAAILLIVLTGSWYLNQRSNGYVTRSFKSAGFNYSLKINKSATETVVSGSKVLKGKDLSNGQTMYVYVGKPSEAGSDCAADSNTQVIATEVIDGQQHNVCAVRALHLYAMSFTHHGSWYFITVFTNTKGADLDENTVRAVMRSIRVNDQQTVKA
jgi:hypothetical protein